MSTTSIRSKSLGFNEFAVNKKTEEKESVSKLDVGNIAGDALVVDMFNYNGTKRNDSAKFIYTIKLEDARRLSKGGVLRVYNHFEPVYIPVERLLGKWRNSHAGVTLIYKNERWTVDGAAAKQLINKEETTVQIAFQRLLKFVKA